jgi:hypothetical protein
MRVLPLLACLAIACGVVDADLDGFTAEQDCDDFNNLVFPGGNELCDGLDNDCNGVADDAYAAGGTVFYLDSDGDGFGATTGTAVACSAPTGFVATADDCDDLDGGVNPLADELCDGIDQDCDRRIDDNAVDAPVWHADYDQDGFGSELVVKRACEMPDGYVADSGDCNDFMGTVNPAGTERCDRIDNDCDREVDEPDAEDARDFYLDADADGFGDESAPLRAWPRCAATASTTTAMVCPTSAPCPPGAT